MHALRRRDRLDTHTNDVRRGASQVSRFLFLAVIGLIAWAVLDYFFGASFFLRADGIVSQKQFIISAPVQAMVTDMTVSPGMHVHAGQKLGTIASEQVEETIATLTTQLTGHLSQVAQLALRREQLRTLVPSAKQRAADAQLVWHQAKGIADQRFLTAMRAAELKGNASKLADEAASLEAESRSLESRLQSLEDAAAGARNAINKLKNSYRDGEIVAPVDGVISAKLASVGEVVVPGNEIAEILTGEKQVLAYLPDSYLFPVSVGDEVEVRYGYNSHQGIVTDLLPLSASVPVEFQRAFQARERGHMMRISVPADIMVPTMARVRIRQSLIAAPVTRRLIKKARSATSTVAASCLPIVESTIRVAIDRIARAFG